MQVARDDGYGVAGRSGDGIDQRKKAGMSETEVWSSGSISYRLAVN